MPPLIQLIRGLSRTGQDAILLYEVAPGASAEMSASLPARVCIAPESIRYSAPKCNNMHMVEDGINTCYARNADRPRWQTWVLVGIIRVLDRQEVVVDALEVESLPGIFNGRIGLQWHSLWIFGIAKHQTVIIHAGYHRFFAVIGCFFVHDAGKGDDLNGVSFIAFAFSRCAQSSKTCRFLSSCAPEIYLPRCSSRDRRC